jgi:hypothetical protein
MKELLYIRMHSHCVERTHVLLLHTIRLLYFILRVRSASQLIDIFIYSTA